MNPRVISTSPIRITPKNTPKPIRRSITPEHVTSPIYLYVISDAGKLVRPHSPTGPPPPLPKPKPIFKRPVCKNPKI